MYRTNSRGQPSSDGPAGWGLGQGLKTSHYKIKLVTKCYTGPRAGNFFTSWVTINFTRTVLHGVSRGGL
jgi:hypothetical protein